MCFCERVVIEKCYNVGNLFTNGTSGGILGSCYSESSVAYYEFNLNYWLNTCGSLYGNRTTNSNENAEPKTVTELKALAETLGDAYAQDNKINEGYPYLIDNRP